MAFGPIMQFKVGELAIELAPLTRESMGSFIDVEHGGGMQRLGVTKHMGRQFAPTLEDEQEWFDKTRTSKSNVAWGIWVLGAEGCTLIGSTDLHGIGEGMSPSFIRQATSGSLIFRPEYWGRGIASAAHKARTWYAFQYLGLHCIKSTVMQRNIGSSKALSRSGYTYTHTVRNAQYTDGQLNHMDSYECLNPIDLFWDQWWHGDVIPPAARKARTLTQAVMAWAEDNVTMP